MHGIAQRHRRSAVQLPQSARAARRVPRARRRRSASVGSRRMSTRRGAGRSGVSRFSVGMSSSLGDARRRRRARALSRASASGLRSTTRGAAGASRRRRADRAGRSVGGAAALDGRPPPVELRAAGAAGELLAASASSRLRRRVGAVAAATSDAIGDEPAGRDVELAGVARRGPVQSSRATARLPAAADGVEPAEPAPRLCRAPASASRSSTASNSSRGELGLALLGELRHERVAHVDEELDVERGVLQPGLGERAGRPVGGGVLLGERDAEQCPRRRRRARRAACPSSRARELGVEDARGVEADLAQAGEVLARGVQHPLLVADGGLQRRRSRRSAGGSKRKMPAPAAEDLDEVGALRVAEARRALGVDRDRARSRRRASRRRRRGRRAIR